MLCHVCVDRDYVFGLQVHLFLHAPLQLTSVVFAASSTSHVCSTMLSSTRGLECLGLISILQLSVGVITPAILVFALDLRTSRTFLPHVQAKRWLLHSSS